MTGLLSALVPLLAVEEAIPASHPVALLAVPLGLLFFGGSVYALLWSSYGARKAGAIYGVAFFGFGLLIGLFWWFGGPGIPPYLGITHFPGGNNTQFAEDWHPFEPGSERSEYVTADDGEAEFQTVTEYLGMEDMAEEDVLEDPRFANLAGSTQAALDEMRSGYLPIDENGVALIGVERRTALEEEITELDLPDDARRARPFFAAEAEGDPTIADDPETGLRVLRAEFQTYANFVDADGVPIGDPEPVGEPGEWYAFYDPGMRWLPSATWTIVALLGFLGSLFWLDRLELRDKRLLAHEVEEPEDLAVPIAQ